MDVKKALEQAKKRNKEAKRLNFAKQMNRKASVSGIIQFFRNTLTANNLGTMAPINKENSHKINGFIKFLRNNGFEDKEIYDFLEKCIKEWQHLTGIQMYTDNRKKYTLDTRPNIVDIIHCKTQIFNELNEDEEDEDIDLLEAWGNR